MSCYTGFEPSTRSFCGPFKLGRTITYTCFNYPAGVSYTIDFVYPYRKKSKKLRSGKRSWFINSPSLQSKGHAHIASSVLPYQCILLLQRPRQKCSRLKSPISLPTIPCQ
ncbi:hypothetical protein AVEN_58201-1 [Araneus ventricosus]|uniref:Uncharacterized protein n=1 Tax=Araneus ventricosus TaxID=182803 RepID=A0A4Y2MEC9_ARAVE|nr:hypothetical protein AVEN_58201-1 [Araneus ventricosus]